MSTDQTQPEEVRETPAPAAPEPKLEKKKDEKPDYGNPFKGLSGWIHRLQLVWVLILNPIGAQSWFAAKSIVAKQYGVIVNRGKEMFLMPVAMVTFYCVVLHYCGVPKEVLGPTWWLTLFACLYTAVSGVATKWLALPIGGVVALSGLLGGLEYAGAIDISAIVGNAFDWLALEFPLHGALFLAVLIVIWNIKGFLLAKVTDVMRLLNNNYDRGRLAKDGDYPAGEHRTYTHIHDWLEWLMTFSGSLGLKSVYGARHEREDDGLDTAVVFLENVPMAGLIKQACSYATSSAAVERRG